MSLKLRTINFKWNFTALTVLLALCSFCTKAAETELKSLELLGFLPMTGTGWVGGAACLPAVRMALRHVNARTGLLDGYNLTYSWVDSQCNAGVAAFKMFQSLSRPPVKMMLMGGGCSTESEATAQTCHLFNITQLSYGSSSPILSDRIRFPTFFRLAGPDQNLNPSKLALMKLFNWKKVATINQALEFFSVVIDDFVKSVQETDITIISQEIFEHDPSTRVENLKIIPTDFQWKNEESPDFIRKFSDNAMRKLKKILVAFGSRKTRQNLQKRDARIIMTACYEDKARHILCHAYKVGLYGPKIVWVFVAWFSSEFWRTQLDDVPCTAEEMEKAADGAFVIGFYYRNRLLTRGIAGLTVPEFESLYRQEPTYDPTKYMFEHVSAPCYDHIWVSALALNCTDARMKEIGHPKTLDQFTYEDGDINEIIVECMSNVSMLGVIGSISFRGGADPVKNVKIERIQGGQRVTVGSYLMDVEPNYFEWNDIGIQWKGGHVPRDSTYITTEEVSIPLPLYVTLTVLSSAGIVCAIAFFAFNILHRNNKIVKLSSPNINNVLLLGCVLTYTTVFMKTTDIVTPSLCKAKAFCFSVGFTIAFGALFSKTWRVYKIFTNKKLLKMSIKDYQLIGMVCGLSAIVILILLIWELLGPQQVTTKRLTKDIYMNGNDAEVHPFVRMCHSQYSTYFEWTIYIIEGALLTFGVFLSWETRHVKIEALNDSHQIGMCIYNVVVLSAVALTLSLLLEDQVVMLYGVTSGCIVIGTTMTQLFVFLPKVLSVYRRNEIEILNVAPFDSSSNSHALAHPTSCSTVQGPTFTNKPSRSLSPRSHGDRLNA